MVIGQEYRLSGNCQDPVCSTREDPPSAVRRPPSELSTQRGEVEPVVVTGARRQRGIGRSLIERVVTEASRRGYDYLAIRPVARNVTAIRTFYDVGFGP
jgi:GNAT superfamily N-acetyltransferase